MDLLEELIDLAKEVKKFEEAVRGEIEKAKKAILERIAGAVICCDYIDRGAAFRFGFLKLWFYSVFMKRKLNLQFWSLFLITGIVYSSNIFRLLN